MKWIALNCTNTTCGAIVDSYGNRRMKALPDGSVVRVMPKMLAKCTTDMIVEGAFLEVKCNSCARVLTFDKSALEALAAD